LKSGVWVVLLAAIGAACMNDKEDAEAHGVHRIKADDGTVCYVFSTPHGAAMDCAIPPLAAPVSLYPISPDPLARCWFAHNDAGRFTKFCDNNGTVIR